jgi:hypothetical protein
MTRLTRVRAMNVLKGLLLSLIGGVLLCSGAHAGPPAVYTTEHSITIDATKLKPASWWSVPGITPSIYESDPESMDAFKTIEKRTIVLKPGKYKFLSFTFDFPFSVNLEGKLEFATSLDQCVEGRGTQTLIVRCKKTYPYGGQPEYKYE